MLVSKTVRRGRRLRRAAMAWRYMRGAVKVEVAWRWRHLAATGMGSSGVRPTARMPRPW